jgi:hypothetical protein
MSLLLFSRQLQKGLLLSVGMLFKKGRAFTAIVNITGIFANKFFANIYMTLQRRKGTPKSKSN